MTEAERQRDIERFIGREIYTCQSSLVEEALKREFFYFDDIENSYRPFDGRLIAPKFCYSCKEAFEALDSETGDCEECFDEDNQPQEIFEWWVISKWLAFKLSAKGEPILDNDYG